MIILDNDKVYGKIEKVKMALGLHDEKKVTTRKGFVISLDSYGYFNIYLADEWAYGKDMRTSEIEAGTIQEAYDFIDSY